MSHTAVTGPFLLYPRVGESLAYIAPQPFTDHVPVIALNLCPPPPWRNIEKNLPCAKGHTRPDKDAVRTLVCCLLMSKSYGCELLP